jgi:hypothetical protein
MDDMSVAFFILFYTETNGEDRTNEEIKWAAKRNFERKLLRKHRLITGISFNKKE